MLAEQEWPRGEFGKGRREVERAVVGEAKIERRLWRLREAGLVEKHKVLHGRPMAWSATSHGLDVAGLAHGTSKIDYRVYDHDLACAWLCLDLERDGRHDVLTEREVAAIDGDDPEPAFSAYSDGPGGRRYKHRPDLVLEEFDEQGRPLAVELERTVKNPGRLLRVLEMYASARHLAGARYYVTTEKALRAVERANAQLLKKRSSARSVEIVEWSEPESIPPPG